ncbi:hypothetical protein FA95DRAFT_1606633 [Auriscalpium vulgare]|uniref:Uncharacterized protein n=1 Tax=Auriscalpium vulgare TaxID=40419 RepID=A0ACB8RRL2_9AGAM|nr:hypothetical protein FA95DRAFT_1606633 [Auriscalpium vulgare]
MAIYVPLDIQILIIEWVFRSSQQAYVDYSTLNACARVCRAWTPTSRRLLFRRIQFTNLHNRGPCRPDCNVRLLLGTLRTRPELAAHVRHIAVYKCRKSCPWLQLLELCRYIDVISLTNWNGANNPLSAALAAHPRSVPLGPAVLILVGNDTSESIHSVVQMCSSARVLIVDNAHCIASLPPTVTALRILSGSLEDCLSVPSPLPALRYLCLVRPCWPGAHLLSAGILAQLHSLQIGGALPPAEVLAQLVRLRTLVVGALPTAPRTRRRCGTLATTPDPLRMLPELRLVTVTRGVEQHVRAELEEMCRDRGVDFGVYATPTDFQLQSLHIWGGFLPQGILVQLVLLRTLAVEELPIGPVTLPRSLRHFGYLSWVEALGASAELAVDPLRALRDLLLVTVTRIVAQHVRAALETMCRNKHVDFGTYAYPSNLTISTGFDDARSPRKGLNPRR